MSLFKEYPRKHDNKYYTRKGQIIRRKNIDDPVNPVQYGEEYCETVMAVYNYMNLTPYLVYSNLIAYTEFVPFHLSTITDTGSTYTFTDLYAWALCSIHDKINTIDPYVLAVDHFKIDIVCNHIVFRMVSGSSTQGVYQYELMGMDGQYSSFSFGLSHDTRNANDYLAIFDKRDDSHYVCYYDYIQKGVSLSNTFTNGKSNFLSRSYHQTDDFDLYSIIKDDDYEHITDFIARVKFNSVPGQNARGWYIDIQFYLNFMIELQFRSNVNFNINQ